MLKKPLGKLDEYQFKLDHRILKASFSPVVWFGAASFLALTVILLGWHFINSQAKAPHWVQYSTLAVGFATLVIYIYPIVA